MFEGNSINVVLTFMTLSVLGILITFMCNNLNIKMHSILLTEISKEIVKDGKFIPDMGIAEKHFIETRFITDYDKYIASECLTGSLDNENLFYICNARVSRKENDVDRDGNRIITEKILYDGMFGILDSKSRYPFDITIAPDITNKYINQIAKNFKKMLNDKDVVRLENVEFERYFEVHSTNQVEARKVITLKFMEQLLNARKNLKKSIYVMYKKNKIYFFVPNGKLITTKFLIFKGITEKVRKENLDSIKALLETMNSL